MTSPNAVIRNDAAKRFELLEQGQIAFADFYDRGGVLVIPYVESPTALRGHGTAGRLLEGVVEHARKDGFKITPVCSYAVAWFRRHPQAADVLA